MRLLLICLLLISSVSVSAGSERTHGRGDTSRGHSSFGSPSAAPEPRDPAVRQYWSDQCRQERDFGMIQSPNCRHPAYIGDGRGWGGDPGFGFGPGFRTAPETVIINRGGTVVLPQGGGGRWSGRDDWRGGNRPSNSGGSLSGWGR